MFYIVIMFYSVPCNKNDILPHSVWKLRAEFLEFFYLFDLFRRNSGILLFSKEWILAQPSTAEIHTLAPNTYTPPRSLMRLWRIFSVPYRSPLRMSQPTLLKERATSTGPIENGSLELKAQKVAFLISLRQLGLDAIPCSILFSFFSIDILGPSSHRAEKTTGLLKPL